MNQTIQPDKMNQSARYYDERVTSRGVVVKDFLATQALSRLHFNPARPVFEVSNTIIFGDNLPAEFKADCLVSKNDATGVKEFELAYPVPQGNRVTFNQQLKDAVANEANVYDRPLVFLVVSNVPHAMIFILYAGELYTVGFGYRDVLGEQKIAQALGKISQGLGHLFETINGAIYTADYLMPSVSQASKLAWVGFLDNAAIRSIEDDLLSTEVIIYSGTVNRGKYMVSNNCTLLLPIKYCEAAGFISKEGGATNCILWAQSKLNIKINCGMSGSPANCQPITEQEFKDIQRNIHSPNLEQVVRGVQIRLNPGNICTQISRTLGLCGGTRRRKNIKNKNKNKKSNKKSNKKTKKNKRKY